MSFFEGVERPEPPRQEPEYRPPAWSGPPDNVLPVGVALNVVLARTEEMAVVVTDARVYPNGIGFGVSMVRRTAQPPGDEPHPFFFHGRHRESDPCLGVGFADGRRAVFDGGPPVPADGAQIRLSSGGGGGGGRRWEFRMWLWPLPPPGPLTFAFAWPGEDIDERLVEVDTGPIRAAAARTVELWPDDRPEPPERPAGWSAYA